MCHSRNVQELTNKMKDEIKGLNQTQIDIAVLTETKINGNKIKYISDYIYIFRVVSKNKRAAEEV